MPEPRLIDRPSFDDFLFVARHMRAIDRQEIMATRWCLGGQAENAEQVAKDCAGSGEFAWVFETLDGFPAVAIGAVPRWPGVWSVWCFGTDDFKHIGRHLTKWVRRVMIPALEAVGCHRAECASLSTHTQAHAWLEALGAVKETVLWQYGRAGEDFYLYVWQRPPQPRQFA